MHNTIFVCAILLAVVFIVQYLLCLKSGKKFIRLIPAYLIITVYVVATILYFSDYIGDTGGVAIGSIFAHILVIINTVALFGDLAAWLVYKLKNRK